KQTEIFQTLSEQLRLRALVLIVLEGELCVCELVHALDVTQPKISRHMSVMRDAGIVVARRHAQWVFYGINSSLSSWQRQIIDAAVAGAKGDIIVKNDRCRLKEMKNRPERCQPG
ncbi:MAG: metalloregulator ArsR/SmtB family transcription factor, partial [Candidatus Methanospirare jalkutatii]|nr:metalloregulator ArsR/SmtB family transcription factor [Candidatus Methanospirare jalkutatii]